MLLAVALTLSLLLGGGGLILTFCLTVGALHVYLFQHLAASFGLNKLLRI